ncbi:MAG: GNAT family N-acetyltransferase [Desertimonas sp.]
MIEPHVRAAHQSDIPDLESLERDARGSLTDARGGARWLADHPIVAPRWSERIAVGGVFVAELHAEPETHRLIVGFLTLGHRGDVAIVEQVFVEPDARELGFGDALLAAATDEARRRGARVFEGEALPGDRDTKNLYERAGITARLITVSTTL